MSTQKMQEKRKLCFIECIKQGELENNPPKAKDIIEYMDSNGCFEEINKDYTDDKEKLKLRQSVFNTLKRRKDLKKLYICEKQHYRSKGDDTSNEFKQNFRIHLTFYDYSEPLRIAEPCIPPRKKLKDRFCPIAIYFCYKARVTTDERERVTYYTDRLYYYICSAFKNGSLWSDYDYYDLNLIGYKGCQILFKSEKDANAIYEQLDDLTK